ncbi:hypothetical protein VSH64_24850 [Amycolatopsis rhabdoformis]|uniref:Uncharacterized protein n=1 Tax=Amycolatopsis rhabdoformis TaxID=1448059 RepID=A0ABZ1HUR6_9PSEU|nr:hypothetical protein [Amycolatopsis rhabdoformis]WSE26107.1 hypothetical protein VSH64_24850 [Amycolatopsis rhabdoformis]
MEPQDIDELVAAATRPEATVSLCLRADLREQWEILNNDLINMQAASQTLGASKEQKDLAQKIHALQDEMAASTIQVRMRAMTKPAWRSMMFSHAPRENDPKDLALGYNRETLPDAIVAESIIEPERTAREWQNVFEVLTSRQYDDLVDTAWALNRKDTSTPVFSLAASLVMPASGEKSRQQSASASRRRASRAKNPES